MIGTTISHYRITEKIGEGGMGIVYKAEDTKLDRPVALKFLAPHLLHDEEGRKRFEREAKAAARLDHPNICTVHEIDEAEGRTFIVMAFLEGRPLSKKIADGPLKLPEAISIAIQMAEGLEAAHEKGVTHRDIKPDNVMLISGSRPLVKLMDFGLAQLAESSRLTREGTILGTPVYMSPEQALGESTDKRSDVWALGVVLYEMVAGRPPFQGEVDQAVIYSIANEQHEPLTAVRTGVPKELERIVDKCLAKGADERYQHVDDLSVDLQRLRAEVEPQASRVGPKASPVKRSPAFWGAVAMAVLGIASLAWWMAGSTEPAVPQYNLTQITRDTGFTGEPSLSPDGRQVVYSSDRDGQGNLDIYIQQIGGGDPLPLTSNDADDSQPSLSADGNLIVFRSRRDGGGLYVIPALGGAARRIADWGRNPRFSPDTSLVSFWRREADNTLQVFHHAWVVSASGGEARRVETNLGLTQPAAWSPDGKYLLVVGTESARDWGIRAPIDWWLVPAEGGSAVNLGARSLFDASELDTDVSWDQFPTPGEWLPEDDWIIFSARLRDGGAVNLWRVGVSADAGRLVGKPQRLTAGTGERAPSASRTGRIAFASETEDWDIWSLPLDANRGAVTGALARVVSGLSTDWFPSVSADGRRLAYTSDRSGNDDIWVRDLETGEDWSGPLRRGQEIRDVLRLTEKA